MLKRYLFVLFFLPSSCAIEKQVKIINDDKNYKIHSEQVSVLVEQVLNYYQRFYDSNICVPSSLDEIDYKIENDFRKTKKIRISEVMEYNQYYIDVAFFVSFREDPLFLRIVLKGGVCDSFKLENFKLYDKQ